MYLLFLVSSEQFLFKIHPRGDAGPDFSEQQYLHWGGTVLFHPAARYQQNKGWHSTNEGSVVVGLHEVAAASLDIADLS